MNQEQLNTIKQRVEKTTPGPWIVAPEKCGPEGQSVYESDSFGWICEVGDPYPRGNNRPQENMEFIAHAREDVPALVAEIERLREALEFYANADNYEPVTIEKWLEGSYKMIKSIVPQSEYVVEDGGEIARQALDGDSDVQWKQDHHT